MSRSCHFEDVTMWIECHPLVNDAKAYFTLPIPLPLPLLLVTTLITLSDFNFQANFWWVSSELRGQFS